MSESAGQARAAIARRAWGEAFAAYENAAEEPLDAADHERHAISAYLVGADEASAKAWERAHRSALQAGDPAAAARYAFWLGWCLLLRGQAAQAGGWFGRTERVIEDAQADCAAAGFLRVPALLTALGAGDATIARDLAVEATELGRRFDEPDLAAFGTLGHGQALLALGDIAGGIARLDEVMASVTAGEVGPITTGIVYCASILEYFQLYDLQRAAEWTAALSEWCEAQPDLVPYRGQCLVHRSQLQQAAGNWLAAMTTAEAARVRLTDPPHPALGLAYYQQAELHRLVGAFDSAEQAYRLASRHGRQPMPGLALLEMARGERAAAVGSIQRALREVGQSWDRPVLLSAAVEIHRANGDVPAARSAADELAAVAAESTAPMLAAMSAQAIGAVLVREGDPAAGLAQLRFAGERWRLLGMPYDAALVAIDIGLACAALGDRMSAELEFDNARGALAALGAGPDLHRLDALIKGLIPAGTTMADAPSMLSDRERQVLALLAAGHTNRDIAAELVISPHTVDRHVEHIFAKLGVNSRVAATAYAYEHDLL